MTMNNEELKEWRAKLGLTQEEMAHKIGVTSLTYKRWEYGQAKPSRMAQVRIKQFRDICLKEKII